MVDKNKHGEIVKAESKNLDFYYGCYCITFAAIKILI